jgi:hypothetical protein
VEAQMEMLENNPTKEERKSQLVQEPQNSNSKHHIQNQVFYHQILEDIGDLNRKKNQIK